MGLQIVARLKPATATACTVVKVSQGGLGNEAKATASIGLSNSECPLASSMSAGERHPLLVPAKSNATLRPANLQGWKPCVREKLHEWPKPLNNSQEACMHWPPTSSRLPANS